MICFLALVMRICFYKLLQSKQKDVSYRKVLWDLKSLRAVELKIQNEPIILRTELKSGAALAFRAMNMRAPNRILSKPGNFSSVVVRQNA